MEGLHYSSQNTQPKVCIGILYLKEATERLGVSRDSGKVARSKEMQMKSFCLIRPKRKGSEREELSIDLCNGQSATKPDVVLELCSICCRWWWIHQKYILWKFLDGHYLLQMATKTVYHPLECWDTATKTEGSPRDRWEDQKEWEEDSQGKMIQI